MTNRSWLWWWWPTLMWLAFCALFAGILIHRLDDGHHTGFTWWFSPTFAILLFVGAIVREVWRTRREQKREQRR